MTAIAVMDDDGTNEVYDAEWSDDSYCECCECHHYGTVAGFTGGKEDGKAEDE